ncbi:hypothetical protein [Brenneria goodwinii]|uniref:hypothetical protein n=1 Tax=Brenneria goodwinii TaxID=1109412 RepID=UPI0036ECCA97
MREANFSESQLQQAVNTAFMQFIADKTKTLPFAHVPSLFDESSLGWDTAFYFKGLKHCLPNPDHQGCNFFIQYKLSGLLTSAGAKEWHDWGTDYFRFKIPHSTKDAHGKFIDDYHQWDSLKELAGKGYPTFYATNSTLSRDELIKAYDSKSLINEIPLLDVRNVHGRHKHVTFTSSSKHFKLHSEVERVEKVSIETALQNVLVQKSSSLRVFVNSLERHLRTRAEKNESLQHYFLRSTESTDNDILSPVQVWRRYLVLSSLVRKYIGAEMIWIPK